jgi:hypothetical protein
MASALPEGQEALEVESACSENRPVGGQAHPVSSNTKTLNIQLTALAEHDITRTVYRPQSYCLDGASTTGPLATMCLGTVTGVLGLFDRTYAYNFRTSMK